MKLRRSLSVLAVFLLTSGSLMGSEPEKRLQVRWSALGKMISGKKVALQLAEGERVEGRVRKVTAASLLVAVKKSSNPSAYPKGKIRIPREAVSRIEVRGFKKHWTAEKPGRIFLTSGTFYGTMTGSMAAIYGTEVGESSKKYYRAFGASAAIATGVAVLAYRALGPKSITIIEILPDSPGDRGPKPTNKDQSSRLKHDTFLLVGENLFMALESLALTPTHHHSSTTVWGAAAPALAEKPSPDRLRQQARRVLMRKGLALDLSSLPVHGAQTGIDCPPDFQYAPGRTPTKREQVLLQDFPGDVHVIDLIVD